MLYYNYPSIITRWWQHCACSTPQGNYTAKKRCRNLTVLTIGLILHYWPEKNVHISEPASDRNSPNDSFVGASNYFKHQTNVKNCWTYTCIKSVITTEYTSIYLEEKHAKLEEKSLCQPCNYSILWRDKWQHCQMWP